MSRRRGAAQPPREQAYSSRFSTTVSTTDTMMLTRQPPRWTRTGMRQPITFFATDFSDDFASAASTALAPAGDAFHSA
jgi:hypothetical protein